MDESEAKGKKEEELSDLILMDYDHIKWILASPGMMHSGVP
jgi:hypothetical protein